MDLIKENKYQKLSSDLEEMYQKILKMKTRLVKSSHYKKYMTPKDVEEIIQQLEEYKNFFNEDE